jgi:hypothetical protein
LSNIRIAKSPVCVVHLARARNGLAPFQTFVASYRLNLAGMGHDLLIILKGFRGSDRVQPFQKEAEALGARTLAISDFGLDLRAYYLAMRRFDYPHFCFLNSYAELLADDWLAKMYSAIQNRGVGLVGATGSGESMYTNALLQREDETSAAPLRRLATAVRTGYCRLCFDPFPNYHIRTNAFLISRSIMLNVWPWSVPTKRSAYLFENGKNNLTKRVSRSGLDALVVGKDGRAYARDQWQASGTFRQQQQANLLIADNQSREYANASPAARRHLSRLAWGDQAQGERADSRTSQ